MYNWSFERVALKNPWEKVSPADHDGGPVGATSPSLVIQNTWTQQLMMVMIISYGENEEAAKKQRSKI